MEYPSEVLNNLTFLKERNIWHVVSENPEVRSCADAAQNRKRLGDVGIPLFDELKSGVGAFASAEGRRYVAVHCRGNQKLDGDKLCNLLGAPYERLPGPELEEAFAASYGRVNPFSLARRADVRQIFDDSVLKTYFPPYTMMTNLGDHRFAIEFNPADVVAVCPGAIVADVVQDRTRHIPTVHRIGILTGNGPESGMLLWQRINALIREHPSKLFEGDLSFPKVFIVSLPEMGLSMELAIRVDAVRPVVLGGVRQLCESGATLVAIACNTTQFFADEAEKECARFGARFIRTADVTAQYLKEQQITIFDFLGINAVADFGGWSGYGQTFAGFDVHKPSVATLEKIKEVAYDVKKEIISAKTINKFRNLIQRTETNAVVLALTELSLVYNDQKLGKRSSKTIVDTVELVARRLSDIYIQEYLLALRPCDVEDDADDNESD
jgi:aspartate racemase